MKSSFIAAGTAFLSGYFNIFAAFLGGAFGTGAEVFVGTIVGVILENLITSDNVTNAEMLQLAVYGLIGAVIGGFLGAYAGFSPQLAGSVVGALSVFFFASAVGPLSALFGRA